MAVSFFLLPDGLNQSFGDAVEGDGVDGWLGGKYSCHGIGRHAGVVRGEDTRHLVGGWRVRRGATGGVIGHVSIGHRGGSIEDVEDDATDVQARLIGGTCRDVPCRRRGVQVHECERCGSTVQV